MNAPQVRLISPATWRAVDRAQLQPHEAPTALRAVHLVSSRTGATQPLIAVGTAFAVGASRAVSAIRFSPHHPYLLHVRAGGIAGRRGPACWNTHPAVDAHHHLEEHCLSAASEQCPAGEDHPCGGRLLLFEITRDEGAAPGQEKWKLVKKYVRCAAR